MDAEDESEPSLPLPSVCSNCTNLLEVPFIRCATCGPTVAICKSCFAMGVEFSDHENDHPYSVVKFDFSIFDDKWTAAEELKLLDAIIENGYGNWPAISNRVKTKTAGECESHYVRRYVECPKDPLPEFPDNHIIDKGAPIIYKLSDNPPRPVEGSGMWHDMGGYSASRGDFNIEFDNFVEMDICQMQLSDDASSSCDSDDGSEDGEKYKSGADDLEKKRTVEEKEKDQDFYKDMKCCVLEIYRHALQERQWRKRLVRDYGLINIKRWYGKLKLRYDRSISLEFFRPFMKLNPPITFDKYLESLLFERTLKSDISRLQDYRKNGLTRLGSIRVFHMLRQRRETTKSRRHLLEDVLNHIKDENSAQTWLARQAVLDNPGKASNTAFPLPRRRIPRLDVTGLPGYDKLNHSEREMCAEVRLVPQAYLDFSKILINECNKNGFLRLAQARTLIKIDVNKTRKLYDFLILHGDINKDVL